MKTQSIKSTAKRSTSAACSSVTSALISDADASASFTAQPVTGKAVSEVSETPDDTTQDVAVKCKAEVEDLFDRTGPSITSSAYFQFPDLDSSSLADHSITSEMELEKLSFDMGTPMQSGICIDTSALCHELGVPTEKEGLGLLAMSPAHSPSTCISESTLASAHQSPVTLAPNSPLPIKAEPIGK